MNENKQHTIDIFERLKGQHVLIHDKVLRFIAIAEDKYDYLYIMYDGKKIHYHTILDRMSQLKDKIDDNHYQDFIRISKMNDDDSDEKFAPKTEDEIFTTKQLAFEHRKEIEKQLTIDDIELLSEIYWKLK